MHEESESITGLEYNTQRPELRVPGYGRNIQKMVKYAISIDSKEERNKIAQAIVSVMGQVNPQLKEIEDLNHKLWTHLFLISDFDLKVDSPYPKPSSTTFTEKPEILDYPQEKIKYGQYGLAIQNMLQVIGDMEEDDKKEYLSGLMANLMKRMYLTWNRNSVEDELIANQINSLSDGKIKLKDDFEFDSTSEILKATGLNKKRPQNNNNNKKNKNRNKKR